MTDKQTDRQAKFIYRRRVFVTRRNVTEASCYLGKLLYGKLFYGEMLLSHYNNNNNNDNSINAI